MRKKYSSSIFINCPFDDKYLELRNALIFTIFDCGFIPRCALEEDNSGNVRVDKIRKLIESSQFGVHDISRTQLDKKTKLPRFNMPLELGVFLGAKFFGDTKQKRKNCLILDKNAYRYQAFISDISGNDIRTHKNKSQILIKQVRDWLHAASSKTVKIPGGKQIWKKYSQFKKDLPKMCKEAKIEIKELTYNDYSQFVSEWLKEKTLD